MPTVELEGAFPQGSPVRLLQTLAVPLVVPTLRLVEGHEEERELARVHHPLGHGALPAHQQRTNKTRVDVPLLEDSVSGSVKSYFHPVP